MKQFLSFFLLICFFIPDFSFCQKGLSSGEVSNLIEPLTNTAKSIPAQTIYLSSDKDIYETQENIWFTALVLNDNYFVSMDDDKIFYLNLLDSDKKKIVSEKYEIIKGQADGHLYLPDSLSPGTYSLMGYTSGSLGNKKTYYRVTKPIEIRKTVLPKILLDYEVIHTEQESLRIFLGAYRRQGGVLSDTKFKLVGRTGSKNVTIAKSNTDGKGEAEIEFVPNEKMETVSVVIPANSKSSEAISLKLKNDSLVTIDFFPEGGSLLKNMSQKIGFRVQNSRGTPVEFKGLLLDGSKVLDTLVSNSVGLGSFYLNPELGKDYMVKPLNDQYITEYKFPNIDELGVAIKTESPLGDSLTFKVLNQRSTEKQEKIYVRIQSRGVVHNIFKGLLKDTVETISVPLRDMASGITEISIYDKEYQCLASRLVFVKPEHRLSAIQKSENRPSYKTKSKVTLDFKVLNHLNESEMINANVTVFDRLYRDDGFNRTMESFFKIESDLTVPVFNASSYFDSNDLNIDNLDLLMLTTRKEDYKWNDSNYHKDVKDFLISEHIHGQVMKRSKEKKMIPVQKKTSVQFFCSQGVFPIETNETGSFIIDRELLIDLRGEKIFLKPLEENRIIQLSNQNDKLVDDLNLEIHPEYSVLKDAKDEHFERKLDYIDLNSTNFLDEVVVRATRNSRPKGVRMGLDFIGSGFDYVCTEYGILNCENHRHGYKPIEGKKYKMNDGTIVTYRSPDADITKKNKSEEYVTIECLYPIRKFHEVKHGSGNTDFGGDFRKTLYWKTGLESDENGEFEVEFYTSDIRGEFLGKIDLYSNKGIFGTCSFAFKVY